MDRNENCTATGMAFPVNITPVTPELQVHHYAWQGDTSTRKTLATKLSSGHHASIQDEAKAIRNAKYPMSTTKTFFEYVKTAYQLNESRDGPFIAVRTNDKTDRMNLTKIDVNEKLCAYKNEIGRSGTCDPDLTEKSTITGIDGPVAEAGDADKTEGICAHEFITADTSGFSRKPLNLHADMITGRPNLETSHTVANSREKDAGAYHHGNERTVHGSSGKTPACQVQRSDSSESKYDGGNGEKANVLRETLKDHLSNVLHEGLLDSVVPYMLPKSASTRSVLKKTALHLNTKKSFVTGCDIENCPSTDITDLAENDKDKRKLIKKTFENEVEIHVCDEAKNIKKDFRCPQKLLVQKMCYFADVTAGQRLEEIDISVHCDVSIFDWLMRWVKKDIIEESERPILETSNVIPIMVSASFLQMEPLLDHCLRYCHRNMSDILKMSTVLTRLNDNLLTRLGDLFSNEDVEALKDKKDKIQSRLFCKLILSLSNRTPECGKGHYGSLASLFKCAKCKKMVIRSVSEAVPCVPSAMKIDDRGNVRSRHTRDNTWDLSEYIIALRSGLRTWRKVYWKLWGDCHFFFCQRCNMYFSLGQMDWCRYHPDIPQFFVNEQQRPVPFPLGRYPCCSQRAYRFQSLQNQEGCKCKEHSPLIGTEEEINTLNIFNAYREAITTEPPQLFFPEKITRLIASDSSFRSDKLTCGETMWWNGLALVPPRPKLGLLGKVWGRLARNRSTESRESQKLSEKLGQNVVPRTSDSLGNSSDVDTDEEENTETEDNNGSSTAEESYHSDESNAWSNVPSSTTCKKKFALASARSWNAGRYWRSGVPVRYNQDNQRDFEERAATQMTTLLTKRMPMESDVFSKSRDKRHNQFWKNNQPNGGTYVKLEAEFRDHSAFSYKHKNSTNGRTSIRTKAHKAT